MCESILIDLRKIILLVFAFAEFPHSQGHSRRTDTPDEFVACPLYLR
jgi:hypothetical protein